MVKVLTTETKSEGTRGSQQHSRYGMSHASPTMCMRGVCDHDVSWACPVDGQSSMGQYLGGAKGKKNSKPNFISS